MGNFYYTWYLQKSIHFGIKFFQEFPQVVHRYFEFQIVIFTHEVFICKNSIQAVGQVIRKFFFNISEIWLIRIFEGLV